MKTSMEMRMGQRGAMTPQLVQAIRLLQLTGMEMEAEAAQWLETNPMLEVDEDEGDEVSAADRIEISTEEHWSSSQSYAGTGATGCASEDDEDAGFVEMEAHESEAIHLRLLRELPMECASARELDVALHVLENIDERGYLECDLEAIGAQHNYQLAELNQALCLIQSLAPAGYGARNLSECLLSQLAQMSESAALEVAKMLAKNHMQPLARREFDRIRAELGIDRELFAQALNLLPALDPAPGIISTESEHVVPDLIVSCQGGNWTLELNPHASPRLRVNAAYERMLVNCGSQGASMRQQLTEARWLLRGLAMRNETLLKTARAIFQHQFAALTQGDGMLKPLSLRELSEIIGMHESTVSRVTQGKYVLTPRGILQLRRFFSVALTSDSGVDASSTAVRSLIRSLIANEPAGQPLCDGKITKTLARRGIFIARRTVAKYRDQMHIPSAKMRAAMMPTAVAA